METICPPNVPQMFRSTFRRSKFKRPYYASGCAIKLYQFKVELATVGESEFSHIEA
jgi:hypothetical protein